VLLDRYASPPVIRHHAAVDDPEPGRREQENSEEQLPRAEAVAKLHSAPIEEDGSLLTKGRRQSREYECRKRER
jgi:hypothetical protein